MIELGHPVGPGARVMFYSHDTFGLGHLRRTLTLANHFRSTIPDLAQLIVSGSPSANRFRMPEGADIVKLPSVTKDEDGDYESRSLSTSFETVRGMRRDILLAAARNFRPDFFIVDHAPAGLRGEAVATLQYLRRELPDTRLVVGLRDIMDDAVTVRKQWAREGVYDLLDNVYDLIMVYGNRDFYDVVSQYGFSSGAADKTRFVGYLGRKPGTRSAEDIRSSLHMKTDKLVVVTAGGGGDGKDLYRAMLRDLTIEHPSDMDVLIVGGPLLSDADRTSVREQLGDDGYVHFLDFTDDLPSYMGAADAVISMGGYNSVCEILSLERPAIIVPRVHPRREQLIRAQMLSQKGLVRMIHPDDLAPSRLLGAARDLIRHPEIRYPKLEMTGLDNVVRAIDPLWRQMRSVSA